MKQPHISTGPHMTRRRDSRFRINTAPGVMEPKYGVNEAHGSFLQRHTVVELRDELNAWLEANPTDEERVRRIVGDALDEDAVRKLVGLVADSEPHDSGRDV
ncbi:hypothetical protein [Cryobacterium sp. BB736]|uniref:hypothetical protein n=1 Tax=Cryobacterium sp. BB736 TaxID=2746963 RepID=UPI00187616E8|nr:hypothetical protein [Cryobacterium sp. BB736]